MPLLRHQSTSPYDQPDQYRRLDSFRRDAPGLFSSLLGRAPDERGAPNLFAVPRSTELILKRETAFGSNSSKVLGQNRAVVLTCFALGRIKVWRFTPHHEAFI